MFQYFCGQLVDIIYAVFVDGILDTVLVVPILCCLFISIIRFFKLLVGSL